MHTKTSVKEFAKPEFSVVREHEEFMWLHDAIEETEAYAGYIVSTFKSLPIDELPMQIPPPPPRPDFEASRAKLTDLGEREATMTKEEFAKVKKELEA